MKQTAVEWLEDELKANLKKVILKGDYELMESLFEQAKAMEKEQIIDLYWDAYNEGKYSTDKTAEEHYNETFKQE